MKKLISLVAIGALLIASVCGCTSKSETSESSAAVAPPTSARPAPPPPPDPRIEADKAWKLADTAHTEEAYNGFVSRYPQDTRAANARSSAAKLAWAHAQKSATTEAFRNFAEHYPGDPHASEAEKMAKGEEISLTDALHHHWVRSHVSGSGLESVSITVKRLVHRPLKLTLPAGTLFVCGGSAQNMVACEDSSIDLTGTDSAEISVTAACANFYLDQPDQSNNFSVQKAHPNPQLRKLLAVIAKTSSSAIARQLAIWSLTDDPTRDEAEGHTTPGPEPADFKAAAALLRHAGIKPSSRRMFEN